MPWIRKAAGAFFARVTGSGFNDYDRGPLYRTSAGEFVSRDKALKNPAFYRGVSVISSAIAHLPWQVFRERPDGGRERVATSPVEWVLSVQPNPEMTAFEWRETVMLHVLLTGNHYSEIVTDGRGALAELWPILPDRVRIIRDVNDRLFYRIADRGNSTVDLPADRIFHVRGMGWTGVQGLDPLSVAQDSIGLATAIEKHAALFFGQGANPGLVVELKNKPSGDALKRMRAEFESVLTGLRNAHRVAFTEVGAQVKPVGTDPERSQLLGSRQFQIGETSRWLGIPPHLLGDLSHATFSNIEHQSRQFLLYSLMPWIVRLEQAANARLFGANRDGLYTKMNVNAYMRGDMQARADFYGRMLQAGVMSVNDIRRLEDLEPIGPEGDVHVMQAQMRDIRSVMATDQGGGDGA